MPRKASEDSGNIKVCVRVRPFIKQELNGERRQEGDPDLECCIGVSAKTSLDIWKDGDRSTRRSYEFDRVYWSHRPDHALYATQETLQAELGDDILTNAIDGFNNCIFAYGQTGSGKSYSVLGGPGQERGLLPRVVEGLFEHTGRLDASTTVCVSVSFLEIYNEKARDLLVDDNGVESSQKLEVKQHPLLGVIVPGLTEAPVENSKEVTDLIEYGSKLRHVGETSMNAESSRSHCVFIFRTSLKDEATEETKRSQTNLVDLAGSERAKRTKAEGSRLREGANINQSLSVLARVISSLAEGKAKSAPFRESKLTYLLKESLSGNSKTIMMAALSPSNWDYEETMSTLKFAQSVKLVRTSARQNKANDQSIEKQLRAEADKLREQLQQLAEQAGDPCQQQLERAQRKLEEQEALLRRYAPGGWEALVEKTEQLRRTAVARVNGDAVMDPKLKAFVAEFYKRHPTISFCLRDGNGSDASSSHALFSSDSSSDGEEEEGGHDADAEGDDDQVVLLSLPGGGEGAEGDSPAGPSRGRRSIAIQGEGLARPAEGPGGEELTAELERLQAEVAGATLLLQRRAQPSGCPSAVLRALVAVDMERAQAHLVVRAEGGSALPGEWLSADEFAARASWLHDAAAAGGGGCAWSASAAALGVPEEGEGAELAPLRRELAAARAELELARAEMQEQELLVEQARGDGAEPALSPCGGDRGERCAEECPGMEEPPGSSEGCRKEALEALDGLWAVIENAGARRRQLRAS